MLDTVVAAALEHVERAGDVGLDIGVGMIERVTDAGLRREVDNPLGPLRGKHRLDHLTLGKVRLDEMESVAALEPPKTGLFERDIVVGLILSSPMTSAPRSSSRAAVWKPMKPAAPVTRMRMWCAPL